MIPELSKSVTNFIIIVALVVFAVVQIQTCNKKVSSEKETVALINSLQDTMRLIVRENNQYKATISAIETREVNTLLQLKSYDSSIISLQNTVKEYQSKLKPGSSVTQFITESKIQVADSTTIAKVDSVIKEGAIYLYPTYVSSKENQWYNYTAIANKDSFNIQFGFKSKFTVVLGRDKNKAFADVYDENPHTMYKSVRTYQVSLPKPKRFGIVVVAGGGPVITSDQIKIAPFVGLGVGYTLIRL